MNRTITFEQPAVDMPVTSGRRVGIITPTDRNVLCLLASGVANRILVPQLGFLGEEYVGGRAGHTRSCWGAVPPQRIGVGSSHSQRRATATLNNLISVWMGIKE